MKLQNKVSALFSAIEEFHGNNDWGSVLDAGTGLNSLKWLRGLATDSITGVTGSEVERKLVLDQHAHGLREQDSIVCGNWAESEFLSNQSFDTVLADYLLGAIEGFAPFYQTYLFEKLRPLTKRVLYVTGLEPYVPVAKPSTQAGKVIWEIGRLRDACVLLSGSNPYREYPAIWVSDQLQASGFRVTEIKHFKTGYKYLFIDAQITIALNSLTAVTDQDLTKSLTKRAEVLRETALNIVDKEGALRHCRNYVIRAEPI